MKLGLNMYNIREVSFSSTTGVRDGRLSIDREDLKALVAQDSRLAGADVELASPGERCRITRVADVIEPRAKIGPSGQEYPGALDISVTVGRGETAALRGAAVVISEYRRPGEPGRGAATFIDMWGDGAEFGPYGGTCNIVVMAKPAEGVSQEEYRLALKIAGLKASVYLAKSVAGQRPDSTEEYSLPPATDHSRQSGLPGVAYIFQVISLQYEPLDSEPVLYGHNIGRIVPTIIHPNEILDGALTAPFSSNFMDTYTIQNHPVILELYRNHGKTLDFRGVIVTNAPNNAPEYERTATIAANLAKWTLGADGAVLTKCGGGAPELVMARTAEKCEQMGIRTALALVHMGLDTTEITAKASTIFSDVPELDAMVSMGTPAGSVKLTLEAAERVIGQPDGSEKGGAELLARQVRGALSQLGDSRLMTVRY